MRKTYITTMPDHIGAFLKASECIEELDINITRVSYNKAVDSHTLFIDLEGTKEQLSEADRKLAEIGYLQQENPEENIVLLEFHLYDVPGTVTGVLKLIHDYGFNISYISSQENGTKYQDFKMGLLVDSEDRLSLFLKDAGELCSVRVIDYNHSEKVYDNSIFYNSFVNGLMKTGDLPDRYREDLLINSNLVMQMLDERGLSPYRTFESISRFVELLMTCRGTAFSPRLSRHRISDRSELYLIEPPCGSNTMIIKSNDSYLFIDCGFALYREEMLHIFRLMLPDFDDMEKTIILTHADLDHCGIISLFDRVITSAKTWECLELEYRGENGYREMNPLHRPYINICKILTRYEPGPTDNVEALWGTTDDVNDLLTRIGHFDFEELHFEVYEGKGGHLRGETVLIDYEHKIAFTGDIYINTHGLTREQAEYNQYAPVLMTSVDTDPKLCAEERKAILELLGEGDWQIFGAHGMKRDYTIG